METSSALRSSHCSITNVHSLVEKSGVIPMQCNRLAISKPGAQIWQKLSFALRKRDDRLLTAAIRTDEAIVNSSVTSCMDSEEKSAIKNGTFPKGFEKLLLEVCDETEIAELKLKIGEFEMHVKRNVGGSKVLPSVISPSIPPPIPSEPMDMSGAYAPPPEAKPQKPSTEKHSPFTNVTFGKSSRLATLEASGASGYVVVSSPTVGSFRRGRTFKGKKLPPTYKEGDLIKVGQVIGWIDQFDTELPIKSDVTGEVMKLLIDEGDAVGFGDPLIAVLPSFQGI